jgi:hypothetical protein
MIQARLHPVPMPGELPFERGPGGQELRRAVPRSSRWVQREDARWRCPGSGSPVLAPFHDLAVPTDSGGRQAADLPVRPERFVHAEDFPLQWNEGTVHVWVSIEGPYTGCRRCTRGGRRSPAIWTAQTSRLVSTR